MKVNFTHKFKSLGSALLIGLSFAAQAQDKPYFQQSVNYSISVKLDDKAHRLHGYEEIQYTNQSPDVLTELWFHLWPNAYKNNETAFGKQEVTNGSTKFYYASEQSRGGIDSLDFKVDGKSVKWEFHPDHIDIARLILNEPIQPGKSVQISTPFRVKIPSSAFSRLGHTKQQYQLCQWYPKPAVYDRKGWHPIPYLNQGEFYSEFGNYEVNITVPSNYVIASSGVMRSNPDEEAFIQAKVEKTNLLMASGFPKTKDSTLSAPTWKTVTYTLENAHDFAWFTDKDYYVQKGSVTLERSGRTIETWTYFTAANSGTWKKGIDYVNDAVKYYSRWVGDYPYPVCKALDGALSAGGGMEYPTITIISPSSSDTQLDEVIAHEVGHNWFYGILASNERQHPWMDEGMNSYYENRYMRLKYPSHNLISTMLPENLTQKLHFERFTNHGLQTVPYVLCARNAIDQKLELPADQYLSINYGTMVYMKTAVVMNYLEGYLGTEKFDAMMQAYFNEWKFKHPYPEDFRKHAETFTGQSLGWFFDDLIDSRKRVDFGIGAIRKTDKGFRVTVRNHGEVNGPVALSLKQGEAVKTYWFAGEKGKRKLEIPADLNQKTEWISVNGTGMIPDVNPKNDQKQLKGLFRKTRPSIGLFTGLERAGKRSLYVLPATGYNYYNGGMLGLMFHNMSLYRKHFEYMLIPMWGTKNGDWAGTGSLSYQIRPVKGWFRTITLQVLGDRYGYSPNFILPTTHFQRISGSVEFRFDNKKHPQSKEERLLKLRHVQTEVYFSSGGQPQVNNFNVLNYSYRNAHAIKPWNFLFEVQQHEEFVKSSLAYSRLFPYAKRRKGLQMRVFAGAFLMTEAAQAMQFDPRFRLSAQNGVQDYLFDQIFLGRGEIQGVFAQQMTMSDAGFVTPSFYGQSDRFMSALNLSSSLPALPLRVFANAAFFGYRVLNYSASSQEFTTTNETGFAAEAGISLPIIPKVFEIYCPLWMSKDLKNAFDLQYGNFEERIRFVLNIKLLNPTQSIRTLSN
jgi:hypothetical protein